MRRRRSTEIKKVSRDQRALLVYELRLKGVPHFKIAEELGISPATVERDLDRILMMLEEQNQKDLEDLRNLELSRLDEAQVSIWHEVLGGNLNAIDSFLAISDRRCRLLGLYTDRKVEQLLNQNLDSFLTAIQGVLPVEYLQRIYALALEFSDTAPKPPLLGGG